jgi:hypothetical protein
VPSDDDDKPRFLRFAAHTVAVALRCSVGSLFPLTVLLQACQTVQRGEDVCRCSAGLAGLRGPGWLLLYRDDGVHTGVGVAQLHGLLQTPIRPGQLLLAGR